MAGGVQIAVNPDEGFEDLVGFFNDLRYTDRRDGGELAGPLVPALDLVVNDHDDRAFLDDVEITSAEFNEESQEVVLEYQVTYSAHNGCRNLSYTDTDDRSVTGRLAGRYWVFDEYVRPPRRSTVDEF